MPRLEHRPNSSPRWQWLADSEWRDPVTGERTAYLAGFASREAAEQYGRQAGYLKPEGVGNEEAAD